MITSTIVVVLMTIGPSLIERSRSSDDERWQLRRWWACVLVVAWIASNWACVAMRGWSRGSFMIAATTLMWAGLIMIVLAQVPEQVARRPGRRVHITLRAALRPRNANLSRTVLVWSLMTPVLGLVPLHYVGALTEHQIDARIATVVGLGLFDPLERIAEITVDQCIATREPKARNVVVPCGHPHDSQVVASVDPSLKCPDVNEFAVGNLLLRVIATGEPYRGFTFCVIQFEIAVEWQRLHQKISRLGLPRTR